MVYDETYYTKEKVGFKNHKVVAKIVELVNTYSVSSFLNLESIQEKIAADKFGSWIEGNVQLSLDFREYNYMDVEISCPEFTVTYKYEADEEFPDGYIFIRVAEREGESVINAFKDFVALVIANAFTSWAGKVVYDENNKPVVLKNLYFNRWSESERKIYDLSVNEKEVMWGVSDPPQMTMSAVSGAAGAVSYEQFLSGDIDDFVLSGFDSKVLKEAKINVRLRVK